MKFASFSYVRQASVYAGVSGFGLCAGVVTRCSLCACSGAEIFVTLRYGKEEKEAHPQPLPKGEKGAHPQPLPKGGEWKWW